MPSLATDATPTDAPASSPRPSPLSMAAWRQFLAVATPYWKGDQRRSAWVLLAVLIVLMLAETQFAVMLNTQTGEMTSALAGREADRFWAAVKASLIVLAFAVPIYAFYYYMRDAFSNHWRRWLTRRFLDGYFDGRKYYELQHSNDIDNPDQRISEDINTFTGRSTHFLLIFVGSAMQLVAFSAVLWSISQLLVAFLAVYSIVGTVIALRVFGSPLIRANFWQLRREADFRFGLMRLRENAESIAFYRGEPQERAQIETRFDAVYKNYASLIKKQRSLNLFQRAFSQLTLVVPSVILANGVLSGEMEVGVAVQAAGAFAVVLGAVSLIVDNFESLSRFVAGIDRLHALSVLVLEPSKPSAAGRAAARVWKSAASKMRVRRRRHALRQTAQGGRGSLIESRVAPHFVLDGVTLYTPQYDRVLVKDLSLVLKPGEGLLITGASGCGKSSLLRAVAGLWRCGSGVVHHPNMRDVFFLPQRPYMQPGTLRSQLLYPAETSGLTDERLLQILDEVKMSPLAGRVGGLDAVQDWDKLLSVGEQQRLAFARVLVRQPRTVILDEATSALDSANEAALYQRLKDNGVTLISIAHRPALLAYHTKVLRLVGDGAWTLHDAAGYRFESQG